MPKKDTDEIVVLLDTSGSMSSQIKDVQGAFAAFIEEQRKVEGRKAKLSLWTFNSPGKLKSFWENLDLDKVGVVELIPSGNTALFDAICETIDITGTRLANTLEDQRPEKVIFLIITDGEENASKKWSHQDVLTRIARQRNDYKWIFQFVGPDPALFGESIPRHQTFFYDQHRIGSTYAVLSAQVKSSRIS